MDVRCERCRVQYAFGEDQVGPDGLTVRCSNCGHVFLVKKKALVVTVPVKPGDLRQEPVATADLDRKAPPPQPAVPSRAGAEKSRPWTLRNHRGDLYPFKELSTLQKWIVERKAARDDEVSHLGGPWKRLGDMLELEPFFALVDRAERAATPAAMRGRGGAPSSSDARGGSVPPTLIDFPPPRQTSPGPAQQPALEKKERLPAPPEAARPEPQPGGLSPTAAESTLSLGAAPVGADEGPVLSGELKPVSGSEPAWTSQPEGVEKPTRPPPEPRRAKRAGFGPILVVLALAAGAAAVYLTNPRWLGLAGSAIQRPTPEALAPASPPGATEAAPPRAPTESTPPAPERPVAAEKAAPEKPAVAGKPAGAAEAPVPGTPQPNAASAPAPPAAPPLAARPPGEGMESRPSTAPAQPPREPAAASAREEEKPTAAVPKEAPASPAGKPTKEPPGAPPAPQTRRPATSQAPMSQPPVSQKASELKRLLAEGHRLRVRGKPEAALKAYGRAIEVEPKNVDALAGRGLCYLDLSQYGPAEESFHAALDADARHAEALMGLAETYRYEGRRTEAVTYYQRYVAAHPDGEDAAAARNAIDALKE